MLPTTIKDLFLRVRDAGDNIAVKIETPDIVHTTHELVDLLTLNTEKEKPALYLVRPDRLSEYQWGKSEWGPPNEIPIDQSLNTVERSANSFAVFIFWDLALRMDDRDGHPTVRGFIPNIFLSPRSTKKFLVFIEPLGTKYPNLISPYFINLNETYPVKNEFRPMLVREARLKGIDVSGQEETLTSALLGLTYTEAKQMVVLAFDQAKKDAGTDLVNFLSRNKEGILSETLGMSILKPTSEDIPFGLDILMQDLEIHRHKNCAEGQKREKGWLLIGTPGSGKSLLAKYLGHQLGYPAISFNISSIMNSLVGQTEKNMHNLTKVLETFAPCVLYFDFSSTQK